MIFYKANLHLEIEDIYLLTEDDHITVSKVFHISSGNY